MFPGFGAWPLGFGAWASPQPLTNPIIPSMPIDYSFEHTTNFRDLTQTGLLLMTRPVVRSLRKLRQLRRGAAVVESPLLDKTGKHFRRSPLSGSL